MDETDVRRVLQFPHAMIGSDGLPDDPLPHPRLWGTFPRVLGHYSRELGLFPLPEAVRKMTGLPAERFGLRQRGLIRQGHFADLVLFDPDIVADRATFATPKVPAAGIEVVTVNGIITLRQGRMTGRRGGRFLPGPGRESEEASDRERHPFSARLRLVRPVADRVRLVDVAQRHRTGEDFLLGGRSLGVFLTLGTTVATMVGTGSSMGAVAFAYVNGWAGMLYGLGGATGILLLGWLFAPVRKLRFLTMSEELSYYVGASTRRSRTLSVC
jgi:hypothetical protein